MKKLGAAAAIVIVILGASWLLFPRSIKKFLRGAKEVSTGRFQDPEGLAVDSAGRIYVSDEDRGTLTVLTPEGATLRTLKRDFLHGDSLVALDLGRIIAIGEHELWSLDLSNESNPISGRIELSSKSGAIVDPEGIARNPETEVLVVTLEDVRKVFVLGPKGPGEFPVPHDPEGIGFLPDGRLLVTFSKDDYCQVFSTDGAPGPRVGQPGSKLGEFDNPDFVITGPDKRVYITDQKNHRIQVFDRDLKPLFAIGRRGKGPGEFEDPEDLAFDSQGRLLVADGGNHRIQVLKPTGEFVSEIR
jgi:DNA-binding beta-propeller fold protein YncE